MPGVTSEKCRTEAGILKRLERVGSAKKKVNAGGCSDADLNPPIGGRFPCPFLSGSEIAILWASKSGIRAIARELGRSPRPSCRRVLRRKYPSHAACVGLSGTTAQWQC